MLQALNDRIKGWLGAFVVALITIPFALWGIQTYVGGSADKYVAKVNDVEITRSEFERTYSNQLARLKQQLGDRLPFSNEQIKSQVLEQLINNRLLESVSFENNYRISDNMLAENIRGLFSRNGEFDREMLEATLASQGLTVSQFESALRSDMRILQKRNSIQMTAFVTDAEVQRLAALQQQKRDISIIRFGMNDHLDEIEITDADIRDFYDENPDRFMNPEKIAVDYVELRGDDLKAEVDIDEQRLQSQYEQYRAGVLRNEERKARHILLGIDSDEANREAQLDQMQEIIDALEDGADFAELAKQYSEDPGSAKQGGDLGWVRPGDMVKVFEDALFELEKGEVSSIVESSFGLHLIRLDDVRTPDVATFEEKRDEFEQQQRDEKVSDIFYDLSEAMATAAFENPDSLDAAIEAIDGQRKKTGLFTRTAGEGVAASDAFRREAFRQAVIEGMNSDIIEIAPDHVAVMRVREHIPASRKPLEEVEDTIRNVLKTKRAHERALADARDAKQQIEGGADIESVISGDQRVERPEPIARSDRGRVEPGIVEAAFQMPHPREDRRSVREVSLLSGDVALVVLNEVMTPDTVNADRKNSMRQQRRSDVAQAEFDYALSMLKDNAEIERSSTTTPE